MPTGQWEEKRGGGRCGSRAGRGRGMWRGAAARGRGPSPGAVLAPAMRPSSPG